MTPKQAATVVTDTLDTVRIKGKRKARKMASSIKFKVLCILIGFMLSFTVALVTFYKVSAWYDTHTIRFHAPIELKFYPIFEVKPRVYMETTKTKTQLTPKIKPQSEIMIVMSEPHGEILWNVYQLETERGKTDYCRNNGLGYGGFGVKYAGEIICYETFQKAADRAEYWLSKLNPDRDLATALCQWNTGTPQPMCTYFMNYNKL